MISQKDLDKLLSDLALEGLDKCKSLALDNGLTGYGFVFDESFVSIRVAGTVRQITDDNFNLDNWDLDSDILEAGRDLLNELYEQCQDYDNDDDWYEEFQSRVYLSAVAALEHLKSLDLSLHNHVYLGVWVSDSDLNIKKAKSTIRRLNNRGQYESFVAYIDSIA